MSRSDARPRINSITKDYRIVREKSLKLASPLSEEDMQIQSMPDASPTKWHLAHTTWAFETFLLKPHLLGYEPFNSHYEYLFNSYYNAIGEQFPRPQRGLLSRPSYSEVINYRNYVDQFMYQLLETDIEPLMPLIRLMINHEQQHQELIMTDIKHALSINPLYPIYTEFEQPEYQISSLEWTTFSAGNYQVGHNNEPFYFDNEGPQHQVYLEPFQLANRLVTSGEYIEFIENGGYQAPSFWLSEAWYKIQEQQIVAPLYWIKQKDRWYHFTLSGLIPVDINAPVTHLNYFEANAYASSINKRLPTEQEWEIASRTVQNEPTTQRPQPFHTRGYNNSGLQQMFGELWQWTSSSYNAYPGFKVSDGAVGEYNGKFMVNQYVLKGGSFVTPQGHIRPSYRNFFYPDASWQFTGIRLAESL